MLKFKMGQCRLPALQFFVKFSFDFRFNAAVPCL